MDLNEELLKAAEKGDTKEVERLIQEGADIEAKDNNGCDGWTPLIWVARNGQTEVAKLLIEKGADVNAKDNFGWPALVFAAWRGYTEIAELLIQNGADVVYFSVTEYGTATISQLRKEKPKIFTEQQRIIIDLYYHPENIPQDKKREVISVLREFQKKGLITKKEALRLFENLQRAWNRNTNITTNKGMRKPKNKSDRKKIRKAIQ